MLKLTRLATIGGNDPMPLAMGAPIRQKLGPAQVGAPTPVPGKPHLFVKPDGMLAYMPPTPDKVGQQPLAHTSAGALGFTPQPGGWRDDTPMRPGWYCATNMADPGTPGSRTYQTAISLRRYWTGHAWSKHSLESGSSAAQRQELLKGFAAATKKMLWRDDIACGWAE